MTLPPDVAEAGALPPIPPELERALRQLLQRQRGRVGPVAKLALHQGRGGALSYVLDEPCCDCSSARRVERGIARP